MFPCFRQRAASLNVSIAEAHRSEGRVRQVHVANIGSIKTGLDGHALVIARWHFWRRANERLARLSNRITREQDMALRMALYARVPMPTPDELRAAAQWEAGLEAAAWRRHQTSSVELTATRKELVETAQAGVTNEIAAAEHAARLAEKAEKRALDPHAVPNTGNPVRQMLKEAGATKQQIYRWRNLAKMTEAELQAKLDRRFGGKPRHGNL